MKKRYKCTIIHSIGMAYSNNRSQNESNEVDKLLRYWGVSDDPYTTFTIIDSTGIDTEEKRSKLLGAISAKIGKHTFLNRQWNQSLFLSLFQVMIIDVVWYLCLHLHSLLTMKLLQIKIVGFVL